MEKTTSILSEFINRVRFEDIPVGIVEEVKRILLDSIGCALGGLHTEKGKIAHSFGTKSGSQPEATIIGGREKVAAPLAAFVNGELFNALDYDALCAPSGHITPYVLSAPLAVAEWKHVSGKDLILAIALAHEIAQRVSSGLVIPERLSRKTSEHGISLQLPIHGYGVNIFGGIAGVARILGLDMEKIEHAFGIGGGMCPVPTLMRFAETVPSSMPKFAPSGWISQAEVTATLLAEMGYTGDRQVFDGEFAFWKSFAADGWDPEIVITGINDSWFLSNAVGFKQYPCCGAMHGALDIFYAIIDRFDIKPEDIKELNIGLNLLAELSLWKNRTIENHIDAQFSTAYVFAVAAHRIEIGHKWQSEETFNAPEIVEFMKKVKVFTPASPHGEKKDHMVEVLVRNTDTKKEIRYTERDVWPVQNVMDDQRLNEKFESNASQLLPSQKIEQALKTILALEEVDDVADMMELVSHRHEPHSRTA
jgi:2-methylcitrate dehydratase PrpD